MDNNEKITKLNDVISNKYEWAVEIANFGYTNQNEVFESFRSSTASEIAENLSDLYNFVTDVVDILLSE